jgi:hypothetical protein
VTNVSEHVFDAKCFASFKIIAANADEARRAAVNLIDGARFDVEADAAGVVEIRLSLDDDGPDLIGVSDQPSSTT